MTVSEIGHIEIALQGFQDFVSLRAETERRFSKELRDSFMTPKREISSFLESSFQDFLDGHKIYPKPGGHTSLHRFVSTKATILVTVSLL